MCTRAVTTTTSYSYCGRLKPECIIYFQRSFHELSNCYCISFSCIAREQGCQPQIHLPNAHPVLRPTLPICLGSHCLTTYAGIFYPVFFKIFFHLCLFPDIPQDSSADAPCLWNHFQLLISLCLDILQPFVNKFPGKKRQTFMACNM